MAFAVNEVTFRKSFNIGSNSMGGGNRLLPYMLVCNLSNNKVIVHS